MSGAARLHQHEGNGVFGIGPARRPGSSSPSEVAQGFGLIPVDSAGETVGVGSEVADEEKIAVNGVEGTVNKDMTNDEMIFEAHKQIVKPLNQSVITSGVRACATRRMCARVRTVRCSL